eukprot:TRINITY_DN8412_c0_g1_i1.p1 TRINITY_DN8412_c0_g1~~TRINITY_DN8412_c0_g1_i1.p1  ORF type:complete len:1536 (-),score=318.52 TRINITY_DN8412_c0_g1_i1:43-4185(-)
MEATFPTPESNKCTKCGESFRIVVKPRRICRCCNREFCASCSNNRKDLTTHKLTNARVCDACFDHLERDDLNCISRLVPYISGGDNMEKSKALTELAKLVSNNDNLKVIPDIDIIEPLFFLIETSSDNIVTKVFTVLSIMCSGGYDFTTDFENEPSKVFSIVRYVSDQYSPELVLESCKTIAFLSMKQTKANLIQANIIPSLIQLLIGEYEDIYQWCAMALYYICASAPEVVLSQGLGEFRGIFGIIRHLSSQQTKLLQFVTGIIELIMINPSVLSLIYENGGFESFVDVINFSDDSVRRNVLQILSKLVSDESIGRKHYLSGITRNGGIKNLMELIESTTDSEIQEQGLSIAFKLASQSFENPQVIEDILAGSAFLVNHINTSNKEIQPLVLQLLLMISNSPLSKDKIGNIGGIQELITLTQSSQVLGQKNFTALHIIAALSDDNPQNTSNIIEMGLLSFVIECMASNELQYQVEATRFISSISGSKQVIQALPNLGALAYLVHLLHSNSSEIVENVVKIFANLSEDSTTRESVLNCGEIQTFVRLNQSDNRKIQLNASRILFSLAKDEEHSEAVGNLEGLLTSLLQQLSSSDMDIRFQASTTLLSCCKNSAKNREVIFNAGAIPHIVGLLSSSDMSTRLDATEVISLFSKEPKFRQALREARALAGVVDNLLSQNEDMQHFSTITVSNIVMNEFDAETVQKMGGVISIVNLLSSPRQEVASSAAMAIGNLAHSAMCRRSMTDAGLLPKILEVLRNSHETLTLQSMSALSVLTVDPFVIHKLPYPDIFVALNDLLASGDEELRGHVVHVIMNICKDPHHWKSFLSIGSFPALIVMSSSKNLEAQGKSIHELASFSVNPEYHEPIINAFGVIYLLNALADNQQEHNRIQLDALCTIANLSHDMNCVKQVIENNGITILSRFLSSYNERYLLLSSLRIFASMLDIDNSAQLSGLLRNENIIPLLIENTSSDDEEILFYACFCLSSLSEDPENAPILVNTVDHLFHLLQTAKDEPLQTFTQILSALKTLVNYSEVRSFLLSSSTYNIFSDISRPENMSIVNTLLLADSSFINKVGEENLEALITHFISSVNDSSSLEILSSLCKSSSARKILIEKNFLTSLSQLVRNPNSQIQSMEIIGNLALDTDAKQLMREEGIIIGILELLNSLFAPPTKKEPINLLSQNIPLVAPENLSGKEKYHLIKNILYTLKHLALSEDNREFIRENDAIPIILGFIVNYNQSIIGLLPECIQLCDNLCYDREIRTLFHQPDIMIKLFELLSEEAENDDLTSKILSLINNLTRDEVNGEILRDYGMMPLVSLLSTHNDHIVIQALFIIVNLIRYDDLRNITRSYVDINILNELANHQNNISIKTLASNIQLILGV